MKKSFALLSLTILSLAAVHCGKKSPEEQLIELAPKFQKAICAKTIGCTKDQFEKIPPQFRSMIPPFMQSEENCVAFFSQKFEEAKKERETSKKELTQEMVDSISTCITALEGTSCDVFQGNKGEGVKIPGCESINNFK